MMDNKTILDILCKIMAVGITVYRTQQFIVGLVLFYTGARIRQECEINYASRMRAHTVWIVLSYVLYNLITWTWK